MASTFTDDDLKAIAIYAMIDDYPDATGIGEMLWDRHPDPETALQTEWDELIDRVYAFIETAEITVEWPDE